MKANTIIIGAGPAGITAAIQLKRAGVNFLLFEKERIGGLLWNANLVENYPGLSTSLPGPKIVERLAKQIETLNIDILKENTISVNEDSGIYYIETDSNKYSASNIIIASGTRSKRLSEQDIKQEIYYEVYPLLKVRDSNIGIIGGGDAAFDYALNLSRWNQVSILFRKPESTCLPLLYERAKENKNIRIFPGTSLDCFVPQGGTRNDKRVKFDHILAAIGREPNIDFLSPELKNHLLEKRPLPGLYFAGDVVRGKSRQLAIAVGDGMSAAMRIINEGYQKNW
jgi:thioredoxin reductase (NADPH)